MLHCDAKSRTCAPWVFWNVIRCRNLYIRICNLHAIRGVDSKSLRGMTKTSLRIKRDTTNNQPFFFFFVFVYVRSEMAISSIRRRELYTVDSCTVVAFGRVAGVGREYCRDYTTQPLIVQFGHWAKIRGTRSTAALL